MLLNGLKTPGARSSEFLLTVLNIVTQICLAWTDTISPEQAAKFGVAGTIAYAIARGLAKYEPRDTPPPPTPPQVPPAA